MYTTTTAPQHMSRDEQIREQLKWLMAAGEGHMPRFDVAIGDPGSFEGSFFQRDGLSNLSVHDIYTRMPLFRAANASGAGKAPRPLSVYLTAAKSRAQHILMLDDLTVEQCQRVGDGRMCMVIQTSPGKHHLCLATSRPVSVSERHACQKVLQQRYGGDAGSTSGEHLGRMCGFKNTKYKNVWVNLISSSFEGRRADVDALLQMGEGVGLISSPPGGFVLDASVPPEAVEVGVGFVAAVPHQAGHAVCVGVGFVHGASGEDESRKEWGWTLAYLRAGKPTSDGIASLASRALARHKHQSLQLCEKYARRTFENAQKSL